MNTYVGHAIGRQSFLDEGVIAPLSELFNDKEDIVRKNAHLALEMTSETPMGQYMAFFKTAHAGVLKMRCKLYTCYIFCDVKLFY